MIQMDIGGVGFALDPAAISAVRYRVTYGESIIAALSACQTAHELEGLLLRMCHAMLPVADRLELPQFAKLARRDEGFFVRALQARDALLATDEHAPAVQEESGEVFDEYMVLALMAVSELDMSLLYELPLLHLVGVVRRCGELRDPERKVYRKLSGNEMGRLYPR